MAKTESGLFCVWSGAVEDVHHFVMDCPRYALKRTALVAHVGSIVSGSALGVPAPVFASMSSQFKAS